MENKRVFFDALLYAIEESTLKAIENQEKRGQQSVIRNQILPKKLREFDIPSVIKWNGVKKSMGFEEEEKIILQNNIEYTKQQYEKVGIIIDDEYDDLFWSVVLPEGWKMEATDHSMWNNVLDDKGRKRISFFYKAAFYDRDAFSSFERRYSFAILPFDNYESDVTHEERIFKPWKVYLTDCGKNVELIKEMTATTRKEYFANDEKLKEIAKKFLFKKYPNWKDVHAYWD